MSALPIFPSSRPLSIVGVCELKFRVRDGERQERRLWRSQATGASGSGLCATQLLRQQGAHRAPQQGSEATAACGGVKGAERVAVIDS